MRTTFATVAIVISFFVAPILAAEPSVEQQFRNADVELAIEQYKKLRMAAFEVGIKLRTERTQSDEERNQLERMRVALLEESQQLRAETLKTVAAALAEAR
jgi:hypothetical protein